MDLYEKIKLLAKTENVSINQMEKDLGFARSYISKFRTVTPSVENLQKIANYLKVSVDYLLGNISYEYCENCGLFFKPDNREDLDKHLAYHRKWEDCVKKYGICDSRIKSDECQILARKHLSEKDIDDIAAKIWLEALLEAEFSDFLREHDFYSPIDFRTFCSRKLAQHNIKTLVNEIVYNKMIDEYGIDYSENPLFDSKVLGSENNLDIETLEIIELLNGLNQYGKKEIIKRLKELSYVPEYNINSNNSICSKE